MISLSSRLKRRSQYLCTPLIPAPSGTKVALGKTAREKILADPMVYRASA